MINLNAVAQVTLPRSQDRTKSRHLIMDGAGVMIPSPPASRFSFPLSSMLNFKSS
jgi:hypothetical protein